MAEPEDPQTEAPQPHDDFDDDLVGFASPRALTGAPSVRAAATPDPEPEPEPILASGSAATEADENEPDPGFVASEPSPEPEAAATPPPDPDPEPTAEAEALADEDPVSTLQPEGAGPGSQPETPSTPAVTDDGFGQAGATRPFERPHSRRDPGVTAEGDARLSLMIYACLIAAAVSAGLTAVLALFLAWTGRLLVKGWTRSHLLYQLRTSLIGVLAGIVGVLTLPLGLGVFILSLTVVWVVVRGAAGLIKLLRREEIRNPRTWSLP